MLHTRRPFPLLSALFLLLVVTACGPNEVDQEPITFEDAGVTDTLMCEAPKSICSGECVNVQENGEHCGACGNACPEGGFWCNGGQCECLSADSTNCNGKCVKLQTDEANCGACGNTCGGGQKCEKGACINLTVVEQLIEETNKARAAGQDCHAGSYPPAPPVTGNSELHEAAQAHADRMASKDFFSHDDPYNMSTPASRVRDTDYGGRFSGENIAAGQPSPKAAVQAWLTSKTGHCKNLMNKGHKEMGAGFIKGVNGASYPTYWVQVFGRGNNNQ